MMVHKEISLDIWVATQKRKLEESNIKKGGNKNKETDKKKEKAERSEKHESEKSRKLQKSMSVWKAWNLKKEGRNFYNQENIISMNNKKL